MNISDKNWDLPISVLFKTESKNVKKLANANIRNLSDLLWILPLRVTTIPHTCPFSDAKPGELFQGTGTIISTNSRPVFWNKARKGKVTLRNVTVIVEDLTTSTTLMLKWFNCYPSFDKKFSRGKPLFFWGKIEESNTAHVINSPELQTAPLLDDNLYITYPTINSVSGTNIKKIIAKIPDDYWENIPDIIPKSILNKHHMLSNTIVFKTLHGRTNPNQYTNNNSSALRKLAYEEFFKEQLAINNKKQQNLTTKTHPVLTDTETKQQTTSIFPFQLTIDQLTAIDDIEKDLSSNFPMKRMIQGDVGSGKTSVAIVSALLTILAKNSGQVALMCPTETLAIQHYKTIIHLFKQNNFTKNINVTLLLGGAVSKRKKETLNNLATGSIDLVIGTHALIQDKVSFSNLQLVIIDEQHKFGVNQRVKLTEKGDAPNTIIMTATPIPRSLGLTQYGDLDISIINSTPPGRKGHKTKVISPDTYNKFLTFINTRISIGEQIYIVVPAIEDSETHELLNLKKTAEQYKTFFPTLSIGELHGKMTSEDKQTVIANFQNKKYNILISTTVIEVGIDIHNATVMAIFNPDRFGLSSLHQLRGRVGRGNRPGFCFLITDQNTSNEAIKRLKIIENSSDGFAIAEEDLRIRGEGNLLGTIQSGKNNYRKVANLAFHGDILETVKNDITSLSTTFLQSSAYISHTSIV